MKEATLKNLDRNLKWTGAIVLLVGSKLVLSFIISGLRTPAELLLSGGLLLIYGFRTLRLRDHLAPGT